MRHQMLNTYDVSCVYLGYLMHCMCDSSLLQLAWGMGLFVGTSQRTVADSVESCESIPGECEFS